MLSLWLRFVVTDYVKAAVSPLDSPGIIIRKRRWFVCIPELSGGLRGNKAFLSYFNKLLSACDSSRQATLQSIPTSATTVTHSTSSNQCDLLNSYCSDGRKFIGKGESATCVQNTHKVTHKNNMGRQREWAAICNGKC